MMKRQFSIRFLLFAIFLSAVLIWSIRAAIDRTQTNFAKTRNAYGAQVVAFMCVEHMKTNNQAWPSDWDDLRDDLDSAVTGSGQKKMNWTMDELIRNIDVDWNTDPSLVKSINEPKPAVWIKHDPESKFHMMSPNEILFRYLKTASIARK